MKFASNFFANFFANSSDELPDITVNFVNSSTRKKGFLNFEGFGNISLSVIYRTFLKQK